MIADPPRESAMAAPGAPAGRPSIGDLLRRLVDDLIVLIRSEMRLAGGEVRANIGHAAGAIGAVALGGLLVSLAMLCLLVAGMAYLAQFVGLVAAALIVAGVAIILGGAAIYVGVTRLKTAQLSPSRVVANLKRDMTTLQGD